MTAGNLLKKLDPTMFEELDYDEVLDLRDEDPFDGEWVRANNAVRERMKKRPLSAQEEHARDSLREAAFRKVYELCENSEIAACVSDDFGLIYEGERTAYTDEWLAKLAQRYAKAQMPYGSL